MKPTRVLSLVLSAAALSACTLSPIVLGPTTPGVNPAGGNAGLISNTGALTTVKGAVKAPSAYVAQGGDPFAGGAGLIAAGGLNYRLQQAEAENQPLAGTEVYLADGEGKPLPGLRPVMTNERGEFEFPGVPEGYTYMVVARARSKAGKPVQFKTLVRGKEGRGDIDPASTLAAEAITEGAGPDLGQLDPERFRKVRDTIREDLAKGGTPDLGDREAVKARIGKLKEQYSELRQDVDALRTEMQQAKAMIEALRKELAARSPEPSLPPLVAQRPLTCIEAFKARDKNGDGVVDFEEAGKPERFQELDRNGDGRIQPEEVCDMPLPPPVAIGCKERFVQLDQNGDGLIEIQEFPDGLPGQAGHQAFLALDANGDVKLTPAEFCAKPDIVIDPVPCDAIFKRADADGDGQLDLEQAARLLPTVNKIAIDEPGVQRLAPVEDPMAVAKRLDRDQDGRLSLAEFCGRPDVVIDPVPCETLFKRVDLDGDGIVTYEESAKLDLNETGDPNVRFLKDHDRDGDGKLTLAEACGGAPPQLDPCHEKFRYVAGRDGVVTPDEIAALGWGKERFLRHDVNGDGQVDLKEFCNPIDILPPAPLPCTERFAQVAGSDGVISYEEAQRAGWGDSFPKVDVNGDKLVGIREFGAAFCDGLLPSPMPTVAPPPSGCDEKFRFYAGRSGAILIDAIGTLGWSKDEFYKYDSNGDGKVDRAEWGWFLCGEPMPTPTTAPTTNPCDEKFRFYAGRAGAILIDAIGSLGWTKDQFYKYDLNGDGKVDRLEWGIAMCGERPPVTTQPVTTTTDSTRTTR